MRKLSPRPREVRDLLMAGRTRAEIAEAMVVAPKTVDSHIANLRERYGVRSVRELLAVAWGERCVALEVRVAELERLLALATVATDSLAGARDAA